MQKANTLNDISCVLNEAARLTNHRHFVIAGSLSILGALVSAPEEMCLSMDVDMYPKFDPGRAGEIAAKIGEYSAFAREHGVYADAISPALLSLPEEWESRLIQIPMGIATGWFLDPLDAAASKLIRGENRDIKWVTSGITNGILQPEVLAVRIKSVINCLDGETAAALRRLQQISQHPVASQKVSHARP